MYVCPYVALNSHANIRGIKSSLNICYKLINFIRECSIVQEIILLIKSVKLLNINGGVICSVPQKTYISHFV